MMEMGNLCDHSEIINLKLKEPVAETHVRPRALGIPFAVPRRSRRYNTRVAITPE